MMPKMSGHDMLKRLREDQDTEQIPVIIVTAKGTEHDITASFRLGAIVHLQKPYETRDLPQKIQAALRLPDTGEAR